MLIGQNVNTFVAELTGPAFPAVTSVGVAALDDTTPALAAFVVLARIDVLDAVAPRYDFLALAAEQQIDWISIYVDVLHATCSKRIG